MRHGIVFLFLPLAVAMAGCADPQINGPYYLGANEKPSRDGKCYVPAEVRAPYSRDYFPVCDTLPQTPTPPFVVYHDDANSSGYQTQAETYPSGATRTAPTAKSAW